MSPSNTVPTIHVQSRSEIPAAVLENLAEAMFGLKGPSVSQNSGSDGDESDSNTGGSDSDDYDDLDYTDLNWTGGRYDYQEQKDFIKKMVLHFSGYTHDPTKTSKERYEERQRILTDRNTQHRRIFAHWPESDKIEKGFDLLRDNPKGLAPPNAPAMWDGPGIWGATLFDLYTTFYVPNCILQTSGSKMLKWCLQHGDSSAAPQMAWAMTEPEPELIEPCDIGELIKDSESRIGMGIASILPATTPVLQQYLPQHLLPETLVVYDPNKLLYTSRDKGTEAQQRYRLKFSAKYDERRKQDEALEVQATAEATKFRDAFIADPHTRNGLPDGRLLSLVPEKGDVEPGPTNQQFFYVNPLRPARASIQEAELRISKKQLLGSGNHSFVYDAHFILPRTTFFEPQLCEGCIEEDMHAQISKYNFPPTFFTDKPGRMVFKDEPVNVKRQPNSILADPPQLRRVLSYEGPLVLLQSTVKYSHIPCSKHWPDVKPPPATAKVRVVAKLSKENDTHLAHEAENYQRFPKYLFEHWSGFIKVPGLRNPVPAGPVVPQFYGYYVPEGDVSDEGQDMEDEHSESAVPFLSPILLLENCGKPIQPEDYRYDDTQECCSLVYRLRYAGFLHASVAKRNIVAQNGPLSAWPLERNFFPGGYANRGSEGGPSGKCFRLIDFGRTEHVDALSRDEQDELIFGDQRRLKQWADGREMLR